MQMQSHNVSLSDTTSKRVISEHLTVHAEQVEALARVKVLGRDVNTAGPIFTKRVSRLAI